MSSIRYYLYYLETQFMGFPLIIKITIFLVLFLLLIYLLSVFRILFLARRINKSDKRRQKIDGKFKEKLEEILFSDENYSAEAVLAELDIDGRKLKKWEKIYLSDLIIKLIREKRNEVE